MNKIYLMLLVLLSLSACKKDALTIDAEKIYVQSNAAKATDPMFSNALYLSLKPDGIAGINPGGDIIYQASYKIKGDKITVSVTDFNMKFKFIVISDSELHGENGEVLTRSNLN